MKYKAKHLRFNGTFWTATLIRWDGVCECTAESKKVVIPQEKRPSLAVIKSCANWY